MNKQNIDISNVILKTNRLVLRPFKIEDLDDFYEYAKTDIGTMAGWLPHKNKKETLEILNKFITDKKTFAITFNNKVIGSLGIEKYKEKELIEYSYKLGRELGFVLAKPYWGKGLMVEAVNEVINYLFNKEKLDFIVCCHFLSNNQSKRVQEKCGFIPYKRISYTTQYNLVVDSCLSILENNKINFSICSLINKPFLKEQMATYFSTKWHISKETYLKSMDECLNKNKAIPQWYVAIEGNEIIGGLGVIENDFHNRKDLFPNICAVYVNENKRNRKVAKALLEYACNDMKEKGINKLYLLTNNSSFYEHCGWKFFDFVLADGEKEMSKMYVHNF